MPDLADEKREKRGQRRTRVKNKVMRGPGDGGEKRKKMDKALHMPGEGSMRGKASTRLKGATESERIG